MKKIFTLILTLCSLIVAVRAQVADTWTQKADFPDSASISTIAFSIGNKAYYGTGYNVITCANEFWEYDPVSNSWTQKASVPGGNRTGAVAFSVGGKGYVGLGSDCNFNLYSDFWEYNVDSDAWTQKANFAGQPRRFAAGFSIGNTGYVTTGYATTAFSDLWAYNPANDSWTQKADFGGGVRTNASVFVIDTVAYVGLGLDGTNYHLDFWQYNPATNAWASKANYQGTSVASAFAFALNGKGYVGGGSTSAMEVKSDFYEYDGGADVWTQRASLSYGLAYGSGFAVNNAGYFVGGQYAIDNYTRALWQYTPVQTANSISQPGNNVTPISITPNPFVNSILLKNIPVNGLGNIDVYNVLGQKLFSKEYGSSEITLQLPDMLAPGVYVLQLSNQQNGLVSYKIVKD